MGIVIDGVVNAGLEGSSERFQVSLTPPSPSCQSGPVWASLSPLEVEQAISQPTGYERSFCPVDRMWARLILGTISRLMRDPALTDQSEFQFGGFAACPVPRVRAWVLRRLR